MAQATQLCVAEPGCESSSPRSQRLTKPALQDGDGWWHDTANVLNANEEIEAPEILSLRERSTQLGLEPGSAS